VAAVLSRLVKKLDRVVLSASRKNTSQLSAHFSGELIEKPLKRQVRYLLTFHRGWIFCLSAKKHIVFSIVISIFL
jgi:hypothetical protein